MGLADFLAAVAPRLARRLGDPADQPGVGQEVAGVGKAADVVDLVEQHPGEDLADPREGAQPMGGEGVLDLDGAFEVQLDVCELLSEGIDEGEVDRDGRADRSLGEAGGDVEFGPVAG
jgi:hypothetical protein